MGDLCEGRQRCCTNLDGRRIGPDQLRVTLFDRRITLLQRVVIGIGNLRRVLGVVELVVMGELLRQTLQLVGRGLFCQIVNRGLGRGLVGGHAGISIFNGISSAI